MRRFAPLALFVILAISACQSSNTDGEASQSSSNTSSTQVTRNVTYTGTVEELEATAFMQGTHKLLLDDGNDILLEANDPGLDLGDYVGKRVDVRGSESATVEEGGTILRVEEVTVLDASSSSSSAMNEPVHCGGIAAFPCPTGFSCVDDPRDSCDPKTGGADCGGICLSSLESSSSATQTTSDPPVVSPAQPTPPPSSPVSAVSSSTATQQTASTSSGDLEEKILLMLKSDYGNAGLWTQQYCTGHIGFCVSAHKNWYFQSFGATTQYLWYVEFGPSPPETIGSGPIVLKLMPGSSASAGGASGSASAKGSVAVGYLD
jgi:hypothetical protein